MFLSAGSAVSCDCPFASISDAEVWTLFSPLVSASGLVLAVSGGPDSLALLLLAARWRAISQERQLPAITVATVDHGLRASAAEEAQAVSHLANALHFPAEILRWEGKKPIRGVQEAARQARYDLLMQVAQKVGASHLATAHHADDQAETVLMRLAAGSGISGLGAMRFTRRLRGHSNSEPLILVRPLLSMPKDKLAALVKEAGLNAIDDPSNYDSRFMRAQLRGLQKQRQALGLTTARLSMLAKRCARADKALDILAQERYAMLACQSEDQIWLHASLWNEPDEIILRCLALGIEQVIAHKTNKPAVIDAPMRLARLEGLMETLQHFAERNSSVQRNLQGVLVSLKADQTLHLRTEPLRRRGLSSRKCLY